MIFHVKGSDKVAGTYKYLKANGLTAETGSEAFDKIHSSDKLNSIVVMRRSKTNLGEQVKEFRDKVKEYNKQIADISEQYICSYPYYWDEVLECLPAHCVELFMHKVKDVDGTISFTGWDRNVLDIK